MILQVRFAAAILLVDLGNQSPQVTDQFALTPDIQYLVDSAQNPTEDSLWIFGLRARLAL